MIRLPDRVFRILERVYRAQDRLRRAELREAVLRQDRSLREYFARQQIAHDMGTCGGVAAGCGFVPCVPRVGP